MWFRSPPFALSWIFLFWNSGRKNQHIFCVKLAHMQSKDFMHINDNENLDNYIWNRPWKFFRWILKTNSTKKSILNPWLKPIRTFFASVLTKGTETHRPQPQSNQQTTGLIVSFNAKQKFYAFTSPSADFFHKHHIDLYMLAISIQLKCIMAVPVLVIVAEKKLKCHCLRLRLSKMLSYESFCW